uniref:Uncharacterized protein n=1 Tax=Chromera velia CCMP2878 TaxID=1169474 RepID=A0A0G4GLD0_9ALVE|eukprot:Cvel_693.t1-p1 / transcript=Cvel_693.t1 / gene=Cvel_693 / organism=Chromera_velia_CCMP2878 / gene_product=hypothetical protein / transcript_product=hypothetical protein / location=Cvel_scaffold21:134176-137063(+) / protein_length=357 / sequence_SO=supercontig / SO=protein_coding / is_pseudo=false
MVGQKGKGAERLAAVASVIDITDKLRNVSVGAVKEKGDAVDVDLSELAEELRPWLLSATMPCTEGEKPEKREREPQEAEAKGKKKRKARRAPQFSVKQWLQHPAAAQLDDSSEEVFEERGREEKESQPVLPAGLPTGAFPEVEPKTSFDFSSGSPMMALAGGDGQITTTAAEGPYPIMIGHIQLKRKGKAERMREKKRRKRETKSEKRHQAELHSIRQERIRSGILFEHPGWLRKETRGFGNQVMPRVDPFQFRSVRQSDQHVAPRGGEDPERTAVLEGRRRRKEARRERKRSAEWRAVRRVAEGMGVTEQLRDAPANFSPEQVQVFTLLPQKGDSEAVLLYKEKKKEYWKEVGRLV